LGPAESSSRRLNLSQSFNGLGWILGPLRGGQLLLGAAPDDTLSMATPYLLLGSLILLIAVLFFFTRLPEIKGGGEAPSSASAPQAEGSIWRHPHFVLAVLAQFFYCAAQTGIFSFFINYVTEADARISPLEASRFLAFGGMLLFMLGRLSGSFLMARFADHKLLTTYASVCILCMVLVMLRCGALSLYALYATFFFMSIMFPTIFALGVARMGAHTQKASSYIIMGVAGGAFAPMLMGYIGEANMAKGFIIPLFCFLYILFFSCKGYKL
jgi:FHS family L-fucose permease-like MFS transporter